MAVGLEKLKVREKSGTKKFMRMVRRKRFPADLCILQIERSRSENQLTKSKCKVTELPGDYGRIRPCSIIRGERKITADLC